MTTMLPGHPANNVPRDSLAALGQKVRELQDAILRLVNAPTLEAAQIGKGGILVNGGGSITIADGGTLSVDGTTTLDGDLTLADGATITASGDIQSANFVAGVSGWKLDGATGNLEINDVTIRGGIIGDDALSDPIEPAVVNSTDFGNTFTGTMTVYLTHAVSVPAGFTQALVHVMSTVTATTSSFVALNAKVSVDGADSDQVETSATNAVAAAPVPFAILATGLAGSFDISVSAQVAGAMASSSGQVYLSASVLFLR